MSTPTRVYVISRTIRMRLAGAVSAFALMVGWSGAAEGATILDFDTLAPGTVVTTLAGIDLSSNIGLDLIVTSMFDTTSGVNSLGVDDGGFEVFFPGDIVTLMLPVPATGVSVHFVSSPVTPGGAFSLVTPSGSAASGAVPTTVLGDGGEVFPVTLSAPHPFTFVELVAGAGLYSFNIDDITVHAAPPRGVAEPSTALLLLLAGVGLWRARGAPRSRARPAVLKYIH